MELNFIFFVSFAKWHIFLSAQQIILQKTLRNALCMCWKSRMHHSLETIKFLVHIIIVLKSLKRFSMHLHSESRTWLFWTRKYLFKSLRKTLNLKRLTRVKKLYKLRHVRRISILMKHFQLNFSHFCHWMKIEFSTLNSATTAQRICLFFFVQIHLQFIHCKSAMCYDKVLPHDDIREKKIWINQGATCRKMNIWLQT